MMKVSSRWFLASSRRRFARVALGVALAASGLWLAWLHWRVQAGFPALADAPSRIYSRPLRLARGVDPVAAGAGAYLARVGYRLVPGPNVGFGEFAVERDQWLIGVRPFRHAGGRETGGLVVVQLGREGRIEKLRYLWRGTALEQVLIEPAEIGAIRPPNKSDRIRVRLAEVPDRVVDAILVTEDRRFFSHSGVDLRRVAGSALANLRARRLVQGGSTITQQLARSAFLTGERTLWRKANELVMALLVERLHTKKEILETYLNTIYLGHDGSIAIHGFGLAARHLFGKDIAQLGLDEAALLAGIIRAPNRYSPFRHPDAARERRNLVLRQLREQEEITESEYREALEAPLDLRPSLPDVGSASYFVDFLLARLSARRGEEALAREGISIYTTLDLALQAQAEEIVRRRLAKVEHDRPALARKRLALQAALVVLEPRSGQLLAMLGGRDYRSSPLNRSVFTSRQPGSTFKPIVALAALSRRGGANVAPITLASLLPDERFALRDRRGTWSPIDHDGRFRGEVTVREALEQSLNVPLVHLAEAVGLGSVLSTARRLGIESRLDPVPSLALGTFEMTVLEMTRAYAVLAAQGTRAPLRLSLGMTERDGDLQREDEPQPLQVFRPAETYLVTSALQGAADRGTAAPLREHGYHGAVAGKTGTTDAFRDGWFVGYTPEIALGVWVGFDDNTPVGLSGSAVGVPIAAALLEAALGPRGVGHWQAPPGVERLHVEVEQAGRCRRFVEFFMPGTAPAHGCAGAGRTKPRPTSNP